MLTNFLVFCSGSDIEMLSHCPKSEKNKYASIGATVLLTGVLAMISGGYALYTIFRGESYALQASIAFGLLWGIVIFNLDRYIVSSLKKEGNWRKELLYATPRFIIAILISLVIAKPLEVRLSADRISGKLLDIQRERRILDKVEADKFRGKTSLEEQVEKQNNLVAEVEAQRDDDPPGAAFQALLVSRNQASQAVNLARSQNYTQIEILRNGIDKIRDNPENQKIDSGQKTPTLILKAKREVSDLQYRISRLQSEISSKQKTVDNFDSQIKQKRQEHSADIARKLADSKTELANKADELHKADTAFKSDLILSDSINSKAFSNNFISQVEALGQLNSTPFTTMWWISLLITLLFMTIETAPIMVKLLSKRGPYDEYLDRVEYEHYLEQQKIISDKNNEINSLLKEVQEMNTLKGEVRIKTETAKLNAELKANETLLNEIAKRQADLAQVAIDKWYETELSKLKGNPNSQFAQTKQQPKVATLEDKLWKASNLQGEIFYLFKNGQPTNNELVYMEGGKTVNGSWEYLSANKVIKINILSNTETYTIENLTETSAKLKTTTNDYLELIKV